MIINGACKIKAALVILCGIQIAGCVQQGPSVVVPRWSIVGDSAENIGMLGSGGGALSVKYNIVDGRVVGVTSVYDDSVSYKDLKNAVNYSGQEKWYCSEFIGMGGGDSITMALWRNEKLGIGIQLTEEVDRPLMLIVLPFDIGTVRGPDDEYHTTGCPSDGRHTKSR